jgi:glycosyltransferase involved in cell wall biosynthesis
LILHGEGDLGIAEPAAADPLVSIILPVYNGERFVAQAIRSALCQTYTNLEIIVVDDGSTDKTRSVLQEFTDERIRIFSQPNCGVARARNRGIAEARGEFIAPLDSDDLWDPRKLELQVRRLQACGDGTGFVYCWWVWVDEKDVVLDRSPEWRVEGRTLELLYEVNFTGNASVPLFRRACLQEIGGYEESFEAQGGTGCEDWDLVLRMAARFDVAVVPELLVGYRRLPESMSTQVDVMCRSQQLLAANISAHQPTMPETATRRSSDQFALYIAGLLFRSGHYVQSLRWALRTWRSGLFWRVLPYVGMLFVRRIFGKKAARPVMTPGCSLDRSHVAPALIPYDRIYSSRARRSPLPLSADRILRSTSLQCIFVILSFLYVFWLQIDNDGLWFQGDSPRHAANGLFWLDALRAHAVGLREFALGYYARYPVINPLAYPPLFYLLEGLAFQLFGPSPYAARVLILVFAVVAGLYTTAWARRWVGPWAGWTGAFLAFVPGMVIWSNTVMLNVPATALGLASLYHFRRWWENRSRKELALSGILSFAATFTYFPGAIAVAVVVSWLFLGHTPDRKRLRTRLGAVAFAALLVLVPAKFAAGFAPAFVHRNLPNLPQLLTIENWAFYPASLPSLLGIPLFLLSIIGLAVAIIWPAATRVEVRWLLTWTLATVGACSLLPAKDSRYILILVPAALIAASLGAASLWRATRLRPAGWLAVLVLALGGCAWSASSFRVPAKLGFRAAAAYVRREAPTECVLYDGYHDGLFGFYYRSLDPRFEGRVALGQQFLYRYGPESTFNWVETDAAATTQEVANLLRSKSGCRWVAIEVGPYSEWANGQKLLRRAVAEPPFELIRSFPVVAPNAERIDLYRLVSPVSPMPAVEVQVGSPAAGKSLWVVPVSR